MGSKILSIKDLEQIKYLETAFCLDLPESFPALPPAMFNYWSEKDKKCIRLIRIKINIMK